MIVHHIYKFFFAAFLIIVTVSYSCSGDDSSEVDEILLTIDKENMLEGDTTFITTFVRNRLNRDVPGVELRYFANDVELPGPFFTTEVSGDYRISATYKDVISQRRDISVISLEDNITEIGLLYNGMKFLPDGKALLTTEEWSVSGSFTFELEFGRFNFEVDTDQIELLQNGQVVDQSSAFHFDDPGTYEFTARIGERVSNSIVLEVREKLDIEEVAIPVIFHVFDSDVSPGNLAQLIDTLNAVFAVEAYTREEVIAGLVNPNASSMKIRFFLADDAPEGFDRGTPGFDGVPREFESQQYFDLVQDNSWTPDKYINVWMVDSFIDLGETPPNYVFSGRGVIETPVMNNYDLSGLERGGGYDANYPPSMAVASKSVLYEHPDYIVTIMGAFLGLFETFNFDCAHHGDYCEDTPTLDFDHPNNGGGGIVSCNSDQQFFPTNFMSVNRRYRDFTYDQVLRVRTVLRHAHGRPL